MRTYRLAGKTLLAVSAGFTGVTLSCTNICEQIANKEM